MKKISKQEYIGADAAYKGWCTVCGDFTTVDQTHPDEVNPERCPNCENISVIGCNVARGTFYTVEE